MFKLLAMPYNLCVILYILALAAAIGSIKWQKINTYAVNIILILAACAGIGGALYHLTGSEEFFAIIDIATTIPNFTFTLGVDYLSGYFILALNILLLPVAVFTPKYLSHYQSNYSLALFNLLNSAFICSLFIVFTARNLLSFYIFWEIMSVSSYCLANYEHNDQETQKASTLYIIMTHLAASLLLIAFLIIFTAVGSMALPTDLTFLNSGWQIILAILLLIGFGTKAGLIPFHIWLPMAHPAAPSNVSALMSGIMIKTAIYGFIRFIFIPLSLPLWFCLIIMLLGIISAIGGIAYAAVENNFKRLLAYSSIENIGIITTAIGVAMVADNLNSPFIATLALMGALFHTLNHTIVKGGLFLSAGSIQYATHTKEIPLLGGLAKLMPFTGTCVLILSLAVAAVVPFATFSSEWLTYQALIALISANTPLVNLLLIITIALLAMTGALAALTFVKFYGITFLGNPRSQQAQNATEIPLSMRLALLLPIVFLIINSLFPSFIINILKTVISSATALPEINPYYIYNLPTYDASPTLANYDPLMIVILLGGLILFGVLLSIVIGGKLKKCYYNTWDCGFTHQTPLMQYSSSAYANPILIIFRLLYQPEFKSGNDNYNPYNRSKLTYQQTIKKPIVQYLYEPLIHTHQKISRILTANLQNGYIQQYLLYILLILLIFIVYNSVL